MAKKLVAKEQPTAPKPVSVDEMVGAIRQVGDALGTQLSLRELTTALRKLHDLQDVKLADGYDAERNEQHVACLKKALQAAVTLEFATIPPYLSALWSIKDELHPAAKSIREVVQEEMLHMSLACNMLASLGGAPQFNTAVPQYPGGLPGGVHKGLTVGLVGLSKASLSAFLWIERPITQVPIEPPYAAGGDGDARKFSLERLASDHPQDETIGEFYDQIRNAFADHIADPKNPRLTTDKQMTGPLAPTVIKDMDSVDYAINLIQKQGEGSRNNPEEHKGDLSHYYRFLELYNEEKYSWNSELKKLEVVGKFEWPDVWPMAPVPAGGYQKDHVSPEVGHHLQMFDNTYSKLVDLLQGAWTDGGQNSLVDAYGVMFDLEWSAKALMQTRLPFGGGATYGPCWRYKASGDRSS